MTGAGASTARGSSVAAEDTTARPSAVELVAQIVNPLGWLVVGTGVVALVAGVVLGWRELLVLGVASLVVLLCSVPFLVGRTAVRVDLSLEPARVQAGESVAAGVVVTNASGRPMLPTLVDVPVGSAVHLYRLPALAAGGRHEETFTIRTERRGVIGVGPVRTRRGDPLGLLSRDQQWTGALEILVRPEMLPLESLGAGLLRDLEGVSTDAVSQSDLAFHALREYVPGDDLRHVHWRSSAKAMAAGDAGALLVRQYLDTRRSHAVVVVDDRSGSWAEAGDVEIAMSVAASITVRAVLDEFEVTFASGPTMSAAGDGYLALDQICRAEPGSEGLLTPVRRVVDGVGDASLAFLVTGPRADFSDLLRSSALLPPHVRRFAVVVDPGVRSKVAESGGVQVLTLGELADLPGLLRWCR